MLPSTVTLSTDEGNQTTLRHSGKPWQLRKNLKYYKYIHESCKQTNPCTHTHTYKLLNLASLYYHTATSMWTLCNWNNFRDPNIWLHRLENSDFRWFGWPKTKRAKLDHTVIVAAINDFCCYFRRIKELGSCTVFFHFVCSDVQM